jgi:predicted nucleic acid-binding protein
MIVVCDTTPINYLIQIGLIDLIPRLYGSACIPPAVVRELEHPKAPLSVRSWIASPPGWLSVESPGPITSAASLDLHVGERDAIGVVERLHGDFLLTDDKQARNVANTLGIKTVTTLLLLDAAASRGWIDFGLAISSLLDTNFRVDRFTVDELKQKYK